MNEIADYIKQIFKHYPYIVMSWGVEYMKPLAASRGNDGGIEMKVNGYQHDGLVQVVLSFNDTFMVTLLDNEKKVIKTIEDVYLDCLVGVIDNEVEKIDDYEARVKADYLSI